MVIKVFISLHFTNIVWFLYFIFFVWNFLFCPLPLYFHIFKNIQIKVFKGFILWNLLWLSHFIWDLSLLLFHRVIIDEHDFCPYSWFAILIIELFIFGNCRIWPNTYISIQTGLFCCFWPWAFKRGFGKRNTLLIDVLIKLLVPFKYLGELGWYLFLQIYWALSLYFSWA